jgi:PRC-barrel domain.
MIARQDFDRIEGATAYDNSGEKIGRVGQLYIDDETGEATWVTVSTGLFGLSESFAPLQGAEFDGKDIRLKYDKQTVKDAPRIDKDQHLDWTSNEISTATTASAVAVRWVTQANLDQPTIGPASNVAAPAPLMRATKSTP